MKTKTNITPTISSLQNELNAPQSLRKNIEKILQQPELTGIYENQIINALLLALKFMEGVLNLVLPAPMQSGKSSTLHFLYNYVLPALGLLKKDEFVLFVTSMRDKDLYEQNRINLEKEYYDFVTGTWMQSRIMVFKIDEFFKSPNPYHVVAHSNIKFIIRDEDQMGAGETSTFDVGFFEQLRKHFTDIPLLSVSATPWDILHAKEQGYPVEVIKGQRPASYFGITEMLQSGNVDDLPEKFETYENTGTGITLNPIVADYTNHLLGFASGVGIVRVSKSTTAIVLSSLIRQAYQGQLVCLFIGSDPNCNFSIKDGIQEMKRLVINQKKRVFLIIVQALSAGKDFKNLKEEVRFIIETREKQLANVVQGLPGRMCGYHKNRTFKIMACKSLLERYSEYEMDNDVFYTQDWKNAIRNGGVSALTTQTELVPWTKAGTKTVIADYKSYSVEELRDPAVQNTISLALGWQQKQYDTLMQSFDPAFYKSKASKLRLKDKPKNTTVRVASAYNKKDNRVHKLWGKVTKDADFGSIMFKKIDYKWGILIANFPVGHPNNSLGFCGIMLIRAGKKQTLTQTTSVYSEAMYSKN